MGEGWWAMLQRLRDAVVNPEYAVRFHAVALLVWLIPGTIVTIVLSNSVLWVAWMSLYAIVVSHWAAFQGAHGEQRVKENED